MYTKPIFEIGDVIAFQLQTLDKAYLSEKHGKGWLKSKFDECFFRSCNGEWVAMRKAYDHISYQSCIVPEICDIWPCFQLYKAVFDECPTMEMLEGVPWANTKYNSGYGVFYTEGNATYLKKRNCKVIGSSFEEIDIIDKMEKNTDCFFFRSSAGGYNADTIILNAIIGED